MKQYATLLIALILTNNSLALNPKQGKQISGNAIQKQNNYTINSKNTGTVELSCQFTNKGKVDASLAIWTAPAQTKPEQQILLKPKETRTLSWKLSLKKDWWCSLYLPKEEHDWQYCHYFAISDPTLSHHQRFRTWNTTTRSTETFYKCSLNNSKAQFFYFE